MKISKKIYRVFEYLVLPILILGGWWLVSKAGWAHPYLFPSPGKVAGAFLELFSSGELMLHLKVSFIRVLSGFGLTVLVAVPLSFLIHAFPLLKRVLRAPLEFLRSVPPLATIPLLILWFGIGEASKTAIICMASFFPVFLNLLNGLNSVDESWKELSHSLNLDWRDYIQSILFPAALPSFLTGIQLGLSYSWRALMGAEMIAAASGLGYLILDAEEMGRVDRVFVGIVALGLSGMVMDRILLKGFGRIAPWADFTKGKLW